MSGAAWGRIPRYLLTAIVVAGVAVFATRVHWAETWAAIRAASPGVFLLAAVVNLASLVLKAARWWLFLRPVGVTSLSLAVRAMFAGAAFNNLLIANAGEAGKVVLVSRAAGVGTEQVLASVALERLFEFAGYVVMLAAAAAVLPLPLHLEAARPYAYVALVTMLALLAWLARHSERAALPPTDAGGMAERVMRYGRAFFDALTRLSTPRRFIVAMALSIVAWALQVVTYQLTARAAHFDIPVVGTVACILAVNLGFAVRATPGNVGVFQAIYALTASAFGMDRDAATGVGLLIQAQQILPVTVIGLVAGSALTAYSARRMKGVLGPPT